MRAVIFSFFLLTLAANIIAGNEQIKKSRSYSRITHTQPEGSSGLVGIIKTRNEIWKNTTITKAKRREKILALYKEAAIFLESPEDYLNLLKNTQHLIPTTDLFLKESLSDFFSKNPTFAQALNLASLSTSNNTDLAIREASLKLIKNPSNFIALVATNLPGNKNDSKNLITYFIKINLPIFKQTKPPIENIIELQNIIFKNQHNLNRTIEVLIKLKETFLYDFNNNELIQLIDYGCLNPAVEYKFQRDILIEGHLDNFFTNNLLDLALALKLDTLCYKTSTAIEVKNHSLKLVTNATDFLNITKIFIKNPSNSLKNELTNFIKSNLLIFKKTNPTIDNIIELQKQIFALQVDAEITAATLLKLKEVFWEDFSGADLIRLLSAGCNDPTNEYKLQLEAFKKSHHINF